VELIEFRGETYPAFQSKGNAAQFCVPFAREFCRGVGVDVGCGRPEWCLPGAIPVDPAFTDWHATRFPPGPPLDYVFSSHALEHIPRWVDALDYWRAALRPGGVMFLYLPDYSQHYWRPWHNRKHVNVLTPEVIRDYLADHGFGHILAAGPDLNHSFTVVGEKPH
jgi:SAM-dependent methyltransferase